MSTESTKPAAKEAAKESVKEAAPKKAPKVIALKDFRDKNNYQIKYAKGQDLSDLDETRIEELIAAGVAEIK